MDKYVSLPPKLRFVWSLLLASSPIPCSFYSSQRYIRHHADCHWEPCPQCQTVALHGASSWGDSGWQLLDTQRCMLQKQGENLCLPIKGYSSQFFAERTVRELLHQESCPRDGLLESKRYRRAWEHVELSLELTRMLRLRLSSDMSGQTMVTWGI